MPSILSQLWNRLRSIIKDCLTFAEIKDAAGCAGLPLEQLGHLQQRPLPECGASKSELIDAIGVLLGALDAHSYRDALSAFTVACVRNQPARHGEIYRVAVKSGFELSPSGQLEVVGVSQWSIPSGANLTEEVPEPSAAVIRNLPSVFVSYSHKDDLFHTQLAKHLKALSFSGDLTFWSDHSITPGERWHSEIKKALTSANVAVLLVTSEFLASDFIRDHELRPILRLHERGEIKLLWVPIRACNWEETGLQEIQSVVSPSKPLAEMKAERDRAWVKICKAIKEAAGA